MEYDQAAAALAASEAQVKAVDEQIRQQQVELGYYQVTSPTAGVVGDIPVRVGDRVTPSTMLTTVDQNAGLEIYVSIPVAQATGLRPGLPLRVLDDQGKVIGTYKVGFVSPSVDDQTQTVLVKADVEQSGRFRTDQFVRVQIVWSTLPGPDGPGRGGEPRQRRVLRVRRGTRAERLDRRAPARRAARARSSATTTSSRAA